MQHTRQNFCYTWYQPGEHIVHILIYLGEVRNSNIFRSNIFHPVIHRHKNKSKKISTLARNQNLRFDRNVRYKIYSHGISNTKGKLMKNSFWLYLLKEHVPFYYVENYLCAYKDCAVKLNEFFFVTFIMLLFEMALIPMKFCTFTELYFNCLLAMHEMCVSFW